MVSLIIFSVGLVLLFAGAEWAVDGASRLARRLGVSPLIIGLTIVAIGVSMPELMVAVVAAGRGSGDIAIGSVIGSNVANITIVLGVAAMIRPIRVEMVLLKREVLLMLGASFLFYLLVLDGVLARWEGAILLVGLLLYFAILFRGARAEPPEIEADYREFVRERGNPLAFFALTVFGLAVLSAAAHMTESGAANVAWMIGMSELAVGIIILGLVTALPELTTSVAASRQGRGYIVAGTVVGSTTFKVVGVLGFAAVVQPIDVHASARPGLHADRQSPASQRAQNAASPYQSVLQARSLSLQGRPELFGIVWGLRHDPR